MNIKRVIKGSLRDVLRDLKENPKEVLLEKENIELLEHIINRESKKLCPKDELDKLNNEKKLYSQEEFSIMLENTKSFVDNYLGIQCDTPKIGHFSFKHFTTRGLYTLGLYTVAASFATGAVAICFIEPPASIIVGTGLLLPTSIMGYCARLFHNMAAKSNHFDKLFRKRLIVEPESPFIVGGTIAHEYSHHVLHELKISDHKVVEGFCRGIQRIYEESIAEYDERYTYWTSWNSCLELNNAYRWACFKTGKEAFYFKQLEGEERGMADKYTIGSALFRLMEERHGTEVYKNFLIAYQFSKAVCFVSD